jgi:hypothetical protein
MQYSYGKMKTNIIIFTYLLTLSIATNVSADPPSTPQSLLSDDIQAGLQQWAKQIYPQWAPDAQSKQLAEQFGIPLDESNGGVIARFYAGNTTPLYAIESQASDELYDIKPNPKNILRPIRQIMKEIPEMGNRLSTLGMFKAFSQHLLTLRPGEHYKFEKLADQTGNKYCQDPFPNAYFLMMYTPLSANPIKLDLFCFANTPDLESDGEVPEAESTNTIKEKNENIDQRLKKTAEKLENTDEALNNLKKELMNSAIPFGNGYYVTYLNRDTTHSINTNIKQWSHDEQSE